MQQFSRRLYFTASVCAILPIGLAVFFQHIDELYPCLLCYLQRGIFILLGAVLLAIGIFYQRYKIKLSLMVFGVISALLGIGVSSRQIWLEYFAPIKSDVCFPPLNYLIENYHFAQVLSFMLQGDSKCSDITWRLLGLDMASWAMLFFIMFAFFGIYDCCQHLFRR